MSEKKFEFPLAASYLGSDSRIASSGIVVYEYPECREVDIYPLDMEGSRAVCRIGVLRDAAVLEDLADYFRELAQRVRAGAEAETPQSSD